MSLNFRNMEIPVAPPKCTTTTDELAETLKCKERCKTAGITVSEYLINNYEHCNPISCDMNDSYKRYPATSTTFDENFNTNPATMVPLRNSAFMQIPKSQQHQDNSINIKEHQQQSQQVPNELRLHPYGMVDDEELKKVRRRIKNKISAQESRRRKKEYMDSLELRLTQKDQEKELLKNRVTELEEKVRLLVDDLFSVKQNNNSHSSIIEAKLRHQDVILGLAHHRQHGGGVQQTTRGTQTGTCLHCFMKSKGGWRNGAQQQRPMKISDVTSQNYDDHHDNGVVPNLSLATDDVDRHSNMEEEEEEGSDEKTESADVDILSLSPTSSSSLRVPLVEREMMTSQHSPNSCHGDVTSPNSLSSNQNADYTANSQSQLCPSQSPINSYQSFLESRQSPFTSRHIPINHHSRHPMTSSMTSQLNTCPSQLLNSRLSPLHPYQSQLNSHPPSQASMTSSQLHARQRSPIGSYHSPRTSRPQSPNSSCQSPSNQSHQSTNSSRHSPTSSRQSPMNSYQSLTNSRQSPINSRQSPLSSGLSPMNSGQSPVNSNQSPVNTFQSPVNGGGECVGVVISEEMKELQDMREKEEADNLEEQEEDVVDNGGVEECRQETEDVEEEKQEEENNRMDMEEEEEETKYQKDSVIAQQDSLMSQLMHTNHLVSPSI